MLYPESQMVATSATPALTENSKRKEKEDDRHHSTKTNPEVNDYGFCMGLELSYGHNHKKGELLPQYLRT